MGCFSHLKKIGPLVWARIGVKRVKSGDFNGGYRGELRPKQYLDKVKILRKILKVRGGVCQVHPESTGETHNL